MGCATSKLENEDTVRRCKERRHLMKEAVYARNHLSAAHSDYCRSLRVTGAALVAFASGEPLLVSQRQQGPAVLRRSDSSAAATKSNTFVSPPRHFIPSISPSPSLHPPPPPRPVSTASSQSSRQQAPPLIRRKKPVKLPHILSDSSFPTSPTFNYNARANSTYSSTPSQASSVWNWDNFYPPPSPPDSEYFQKLDNNNNNPSTHKEDQSDFDHHTDYDNEEKASSFRSHSNARDHSRQFIPRKQSDDQASNYSTHSHYPESQSKSYTREAPEIVHKKGQNPIRWDSDEEEEETEREEVQCSEWGDHDHYSTSTDEDERGDLKSRSDFGRGKNEASVPPSDMGATNLNSNSKYSSKLEKLSDDEKSSVSWGIGNHESMNLDRRIVVRHKDLSEIVAAIEEYFDKASSAGEQVSEMLEIGRAQFDRSFKQLKKTVYHSTGILSTLSSSWTSKPPLAVKYRFDPDSLEHPGGAKCLCSTMERLLAWEKKLYEEVKAREGVKIEHEKKLSSLQSQEYRGEDEAKLDKTKTSIKKLQSLIVVTSQAVSATSSAIIGLRDTDLVPQLVELCHGFMYAWRSLHQFHEAQSEIVQQVRGLVSQTSRGESTSDLHRQATSYLESAVTEWHSSFCRLVKFHRGFVRSLHGWFKLTLLPVTSEQGNANRDLDKVFGFMDEWKLALDRVPDTVASEAIKSFINVVHSISLKQTEELKIKKRTESVSKELEKKASSLRSIEKKYYLSYSTVGVGLPDAGHGLDARDLLAEKKAELAVCERRVEDEMIRHLRAVEVTRAMTLNNLQTGLPGVFQAMTGFSSLITESLQTVCTHSYAI